MASSIARSIVIKKADKGSSIVIWDRVNYLKEANKQLSDKNESQGNHS